MEELVTCEGTVHSIIFQNAENGYTVLRLLTEEGEVITVVGCIPCVAPGEHLAVSGVPETHPQHGEQLRAVELERSLPEDEEEIFSYLSSGICKGVGPATARRIVERFGAETLDVLEREPERLTTLKGVTARKAQEIAESFRQHMGLRRLMAFLAQYQLPPVLAMELRRQYGDAALEKVRENPYILSGEACGVEFSVTDGIAMGMGLAADSDQRLQAAVTFELSHNENNGHVFLPRNKLISATTQLLDSGAELVEQALDSLNGARWSRNRWPMWRPATSGGCGRRSVPPASAWRGCWLRIQTAAPRRAGRWTSWRPTSPTLTTTKPRRMKRSSATT